MATTVPAARSAAIRSAWHVRQPPDSAWPTSAASLACRSRIVNDQAADFAAQPVTAPADGLEKLSASARRWHTIKMALLGFIGICGIVRTAGSPAPHTIQWLATALAFAALAASSPSIFTVGRLALPFNDSTDGTSSVSTSEQSAVLLALASSSPSSL